MVNLFCFYYLLLVVVLVCSPNMIDETLHGLMTRLILGGSGGRRRGFRVKVPSQDSVAQYTLSLQCVFVVGVAIAG